MSEVQDPHPRLALNPVANLFRPDDELVAVNSPRWFIFNVDGSLFLVPEGIMQLPLRLLNDPWFQANQVVPYDGGGNGA
jgi:hypothetical protein